MIDSKLMEVILTPPDSALALVTHGEEGPHIVNSWNSYIRFSDLGELLLPVGRMHLTEKNLANSSSVLLTITNREVKGERYKGTGFLIKGQGKFLKEGDCYNIIKTDFPWARAAIAITIDSLEQTL